MNNNDMYKYASTTKECPDCYGAILLVKRTNAERIYKCIEPGCNWMGDKPLVAGIW